MPYINSSQIIIALAFFTIGLFVYWLYNQSKMKLLIENSQNDLKTELKINKLKLNKLEENSNKQLESIKHHEKQQLVYTQKNKKLTTTVALYNQKFQQLKNQHSELQTLKQQLLDAHDKSLIAQSKIAELQTLNSQQKKAYSEKEEILKGTKSEIKTQFKSLAQEIFEEKNHKTALNNQQSLETLLKPFSKQLDDFKQKVEDVYNNEGKQRASLISEVRQLKELNHQLNKEAINLTRALKGDKKIQGNWGELILERVLEQSGLRKGHEFDSQGGFRDNDNNILKPDVIIHLPQGKDIIIDSKVSLVSYEKFSTSENKNDQKIALNAHVLAIKEHIKTLSEKDYSALKGIKTLDFVVMFIPIESAFVSAFESNDELFTHAFAKKIIIATPTTLLAILKTVENLWRYEKQNINARDIAEKAGIIYDKFRGFIQDIEKLGKQIDTTQNTYHDALNKLTRGRGNLVNQAQQLLELGVKVKKEIPTTILNNAQIPEKQKE